MTTENETAFSDDERGLIALDASYEIENMVDVMMMVVKDASLEDGLRFRGLAARIDLLNGVIMSAITDKGEPNDELRDQLYTRHKPKAT